MTLLSQNVFSVPEWRNVGNVERLSGVRVAAGRRLHSDAVAGSRALAPPPPAQEPRPRTAAPLAPPQQPARRHTQLHAAAAGRHILHWRGRSQDICLRNLCPPLGVGLFNPSHNSIVSLLRHNADGICENRRSLEDALGYIC